MIADRAQVIVSTVFDRYPAYGGSFVWVGALLYSMQIYADFNACSCLARGVALLFGVRLKNNFNRPFFSMSFPEFRRRWHISLGSWLKDYIYIPLGGGKKGNARKCNSLPVRWALYTGIILVIVVFGCYGFGMESQSFIYGGF